MGLFSSLMGASYSCDLCGEGLESEEYEHTFLLTYGLRKVRAIVTLIDDEDNEGEHICRTCAKQAVDNGTVQWEPDEG